MSQRNLQQPQGHKAMSSILTNMSAMTALQTLTQTQKDLTETQGQISSGLRVASAADNAAYWSISTTMKSDNNALNGVQDALNIGSSTINVASSAMNSVVDVLNQMKSQLVAAAEPGIDRTKVQSQLTALEGQLKSIASSASFSGENWLSVDSGSANYNSTKSVIASFTRDANGNAVVGSINIDISSVKLYDANGETTTAQTATAAAASAAATANLAYNTAEATAQQTGAAADIAAAATAKAAAQAAMAALATATTNSGIIDKTRVANGTVLTGGIASMDIHALTDSSADQTTLQDYISMTDQALQDVTSAASQLGATSSRIGLQQTFVTNLMNSVTQGIGSLVDADMNKESTKLSALQVQQQLGVQSLNIANQNSQLILKLFGG
jgi:flagellin